MARVVLLSATPADDQTDFNLAPLQEAQKCTEIAARLQWERWFAEDVLFHQLTELCLDIQRKRKLPERWTRWTAFLHYLQRFHFRRLIGTTLRALWSSRKTENAEPQQYARG